MLSHGLEKGYYANGSGPLRTPLSPLLVHSGKGANSPSGAAVDIPTESHYYENADILEFYVGYENELKIEDTIVVWSWVERERVITDNELPLDVVVFEFCAVDEQGQERLISLCRTVIRERLEKLTPQPVLEKTGAKL